MPDAAASVPFPPPPEPVWRCPLDWWRLKRGMTVAELARALGVSHPVLSRTMRHPGARGFREASLELRFRVKTYTCGAVGIEDWPDTAVAPGKYGKGAAS